MRLYEFVRSYDLALDELRNSNAEACSLSENTSVVPCIGIVALEMDAVDIYTRNVFRMVRKQLGRQGLYYNVDVVCGDDTSRFYMKKYNSLAETWIVELNKNSGNPFNFTRILRVYNAKQVCRKQVYGGSIDSMSMNYVVEHVVVKINHNYMSRVGEYVEETTFCLYPEYDDDFFMFLAFSNWNEIDLPLLPYLDSMHIVTWDAQRVLKQDFLEIVNTIHTLAYQWFSLSHKNNPDGIKSIGNWELKVIYVQKDNMLNETLFFYKKNTIILNECFREGEDLYRFTITRAQYLAFI
ncbi:hypothetical protein M9H77_18534 [Catharanthus roseus]|uniref:Uncharacterized protein n=1 Tax=Catharanthus roseus TaxID=4058 RepID=A0ACC0B7S6_CATRO|nr:hypothetical protein M9H77_18534 [Catharanthus roseus]